MDRWHRPAAFPLRSGARCARWIRRLGPTTCNTERKLTDKSLLARAASPSGGEPEALGPSRNASRGGGQPERTQRARPDESTARGAAWRRLLRPLASLPLAICELAAIAALSSVGTVVEQHQPHAFYVKNYPDEGPRVLGFVTYRLIEALQLDHLYTSAAFLALLALLAASLAACTCTTQWPQARIAQNWRFKSNRGALGALPASALVPDARLDDLARVLAGRGYQVFVDGGRMYAFKGLVGRLAPIGVHASMLAVMAGIALGAVGGYNGTLVAAEGSDTVVGAALVPRSGAARPPPGAAATLHVDKFTIDFRSDGSVRQFYTDVSVTGPGGRPTRRTLFVNKPLRFGGVTAYQTDWGLAALRVDVRPAGADGGGPLAPAPGRRQLTLPLVSVGAKTWATYLPLEALTPGGPRPRGVALVAEDPQAVVVYDSKGAVAGVTRPGSGRAVAVEGVAIRVDGVVASTGLELKSDPGVPLVYAGFGGMCVTTVLSCLSHSQVWAAQEGGAVVLGGRTNRANFAFERELDAAVQAVPVSGQRGDVRPVEPRFAGHGE